jgi:valyl-tRNA synthetase
MGFLCGASSVGVLPAGEAAPEQAVSVVVPGAVLYLPLADLVDTAKEKERLAREREKLLKELARLDGKLKNAGFTAKAPAEVVAAEREKRENFAAMLEKVEIQLGNENAE